MLRRVNHLSPFKELTPLLKAQQISCLIPLFLSAWRLTNLSLYFTDLSLALVKSSSHGADSPAIHSHACEVTAQVTWLSRRKGSEGCCAALVSCQHGCGKVGTVHQSRSFSSWWFVYGRDMIIT